MEAKAIASTVRITPRKVRLVIDLIRNKPVGEALAILKLTPKGACDAVAKVIQSAASNATHNLNLNYDLLYIKEASANDGPRMKRMLPRAKGRGDIIQKRTCHITIVVAEKE